MRRVLLHVHLFKNAGTSIERGLETFFGETWKAYDRREAEHTVTSDDLRSFLDSQPALRAVSSHQVRPPFNGDARIALDPLVFLRHPIDRIRSAYEFERGQRAETPSSQAAATMSLAGWINFHTERSSSQCANFQVLALSSLRRPDGGIVRAETIHAHYASARLLLSRLPVVGLVENYDWSCGAVSRAYSNWYPGLQLAPVHANAANQGTDLHERLEQVRRSLGVERYLRLEADNHADFKLWRWVQQTHPAELMAKLTSSHRPFDSTAGYHSFR